MGGALLGIGVQIAVALAELARGGTFFYSGWKNPDALTWHGVIRLGSTSADPNYLAC